MDPATASAGGQLGGSLLSYQGQRETNATNYRIAQEQMRFQQASAREAMNFEDAQARAQMKFQDRMSSSAMQRMKDDFEKAGVNPLLGLSNPASTPTGASGSGSSATGASATMENALDAFSGSAKDIMNLKLAMDKQKEEIGLIRAQKNNVNVDSAVKTKGIPEAELKNEAYEILRPILDSIKRGSVGDKLGEFWTDTKADYANPKSKLKTLDLKKLQKP